MWEGGWGGGGGGGRGEEGGDAPPALGEVGPPIRPIAGEGRAVSGLAAAIPLPPPLPGGAAETEAEAAEGLFGMLRECREAEEEDAVVMPPQPRSRLFSKAATSWGGLMRAAAPTGPSCKQTASIHIDI